jgi:hypothetical protein
LFDSYYSFSFLTCPHLHSFCLSLTRSPYFFFRIPPTRFPLLVREGSLRSVRFSLCPYILIYKFTFLFLFLSFVAVALCFLYLFGHNRSWFHLSFSLFSFILLYPLSLLSHAFSSYFHTRYKYPSNVPFSPITSFRRNKLIYLILNIIEELHAVIYILIKIYKFITDEKTLANTKITIDRAYFTLRKEKINKLIRNENKLRGRIVARNVNGT